LDEHFQSSILFTTCSRSKIPFQCYIGVSEAGEINLSLSAFAEETDYLTGKT
jgi:hypothetical protein